MIKYLSLYASEDIENYTICHAALNSVRKMRHRDDINGKLVFIDQIPKVDQVDIYTIKEGEVVRCVELTVVPKTVI